MYLQKEIYVCICMLIPACNTDPFLTLSGTDCCADRTGLSKVVVGVGIKVLSQRTLVISADLGSRPLVKVVCFNCVIHVG